MKGKKFTAALLVAGMVFTINLVNAEAASMAKSAKKAVKIVQTAGRDRLGEFARMC